jgi:hypothetical protein
LPDEQRKVKQQLYLIEVRGVKETRALPPPPPPTSPPLVEQQVLPNKAADFISSTTTQDVGPGTNVAILLFHRLLLQE